MQMRVVLRTACLVSAVLLDFGKFGLESRKPAIFATRLSF